VLRIGLVAYDWMIGLDLADLAVDGSITKSPCGGEMSGRSPVDRGKQGTKRSVVCDGDGIPLHLLAARANDHDSPLLEPTLAGIPDMIAPAGRPAMHASRPRLGLHQDPGPTRDPGLRRRHRDQGHTRPDPSRQALARGTHPLLDERLRQTPPMH
jgi:hypothetical protein